MNIFTEIEKIKNCDDCVLTIGSYDGLHRGHQDIIKTLTTTAAAKSKKSALITFDPHPRHVLDNNKKLSLLGENYYFIGQELDKGIAANLKIKEVSSLDKSSFLLVRG